MKKKNMAIIVTIFMLVTGCRKVREYNKYMVCSLINFDEITIVSSINGGKLDEVILTKNNDVYAIDYDGLFKESESNCKFIGKLDKEIIVGDDFSVFTKTHYFTKGHDLLKKENLSVDGPAWELIEYSPKKSLDNSPLNLYVENGNIYLSENSKINTNFEMDEKIKTIYFRGDYIKTNKHIYKLIKSKLNKEECEKYTDVACKYSYSYEIDEKFDEYYDRIAYISIFQDGVFYGTSDWFYGAVLIDGTIKVPNPPSK